MTPRIPELGKDKLLTIEEAVRAIKENPYDPSMDAVLTELVQENKVRVWFMDGELRFQYNPYPNGEPQQCLSTANSPS